MATRNRICPELLFVGGAGGVGPAAEFEFEFASGVAPTTDDPSSRGTTNWTVDLAGGYELQNGLGLNVISLYTGLGVSNSVLSGLDVPGGEAHMSSIGVGLKRRLPVAGDVNGYSVDDARARVSKAWPSLRARPIVVGDMSACAIGGGGFRRQVTARRRFDYSSHSPERAHPSATSVS
jgi:hypothetical protein